MLFSYRGSTQLTICDNTCSVTYNRYDNILLRTCCCREGYVTPDGIFCWSRCFNHWEVSFLDCGFVMVCALGFRYLLLLPAANRHHTLNIKYILFGELITRQ